MIEEGKHEEVLKMTDGVVKLFMLMGCNHSWNANWQYLMANPNDPNFQNLKCNVFTYFDYKTEGHPDVVKLQIVSLVFYSVYSTSC